MSLEDCQKKIKVLSSQHSFSSGREIINNNFEAFKGCISELQNVIDTNNGGNGTLTGGSIIFPTNPNPSIEYNLQYSPTSNNWFLAQDDGETFLGGGTVYHLLDGEQLNVKERHQHIVLQEFILDGTAEIVLSPSGELVIL